MTYIIVALIILAYAFIATGHYTGVNKAAIAMFLGTVGWVVYVGWGTDYVMQQHPTDYVSYLDGQPATSRAVKGFIQEDIFLSYVGRAASVVMFLLATMSITELLQGNGCFDFIAKWASSRNKYQVAAVLTVVTFVVSAHLDNLTTATMMLMVMHSVIRNRRQRMLLGAMVLIAANCGGLFTVIGDPIGLILWEKAAVTATNFSAWLMLPAIVATAVPVLLILRCLPPRLETEWVVAPFRGDDTRLSRWQRAAMLIVGIGGLWFVPTFHNITGLSPFLGALCVLSVLWVVNEAVNRRVNDADQMAARRIPRALQYGAMQQMLFVMGIMLSMGVMIESGIMGGMARFASDIFASPWAIAIVAGLLSSLIDTFTVAITAVSLYDVAADGLFAVNALYWKLIAFTTATGGCLMLFGSTSGIALAKAEHVGFGWYLRHIAPKMLLGIVAGLLVIYLETVLL